METLRSFLGATRSDCQERFESGRPVRGEDIVGYLYHGLSLGLPTWVEKLSWQQFGKAFFVRDDGTLGGHNLRMHQDGIDQPWRVQRRRKRERSFGPYRLRERSDGLGIEIDYNVPESAGSPLRLLSDPLVALDSDGDLLLGRSDLRIFGRTVPTPSWFVLARFAPYTPTAP